MPVPVATPTLSRRQRRLLASGRARLFADGGGAGVAIPDAPDKLEEMLNDDTALQAVIAEGQLGDFLKAYARATNAADPTIQDQVRDETQRVLAEMLREHGIDTDKRPDVRSKVPGPYDDAGPLARAQGLYNPKALGAQVDDLFDSAGEYFKMIWRGNSAKNTPEVQGKLERLRNFSSDVPSDGGFLIPERLRSELLRVALETALVRPRARIVPMETLRVPFPAIDSTSNVNSVFGGLTGFWTEEGGQLESSKPRFGRVVLDAKKLTIYTEVPSELLADSLISLTGFIDQAFPEALAFFEDIAFLTGSGVGQPLGALNGNAAVRVPRTTSGEIHFEDTITMFSRMLPASLSRAVWVASIDTFPQLASMVITRGTDGIASPAVWLNNGQVIGGPPATILGRPVVFTEKTPALGNTGDLNLVDFGFYLIGDRQAMQARQSEDFRFDTDEIAFRVIERVDGRPWLQSPITPHNGGAALSPIVSLDASDS